MTSDCESRKHVPGSGICRRRALFLRSLTQRRSARKSAVYPLQKRWVFHRTRRSKTSRCVCVQITELKHGTATAQRGNSPHRALSLSLSLSLSHTHTHTHTPTPTPTPTHPHTHCHPTVLSYSLVQDALRAGKRPKVESPREPLTTTEQGALAPHDGGVVVEGLSAAPPSDESKLRGGSGKELTFELSKGWWSLA
jgi:hypothetical protein